MYRKRVKIQNQSLAPQSIMEKPMEVCDVDEWFIVIPYNAGLHVLQSAIIVDQSSVKGGLKFIDCIVQSAWCTNGIQLLIGALLGW